MEFSDTSNKDGIIQGIESVCGMKFGDISTNSAPDYLLNWFTNEINNWVNYCGIWIHNVNKEWIFDDSNNTGMAIETYAFVDEQDNYHLDSNIKQIVTVEVSDEDGANFENIDLIDLKDRPEDTFNEDAGTPTGFWFSGESIIFYPNPDTAKTKNFRLTYSRDMVLFDITDTTAQPGFANAFHSILIYGPAYTWATIKKQNNIAQLCKEHLYGSYRNGTIGLIPELKKFYKTRAYEQASKVGRKAVLGGSWE